MDNSIKAWLYDVLQAIEEIDSFLVEGNFTFEYYEKDIKTKRAVERNLEIIGEAIGRILKKEPGYKIKNSLRIIGTRNRIIHGYDLVSDKLIWSVVTTYLPELRLEVEGLLEL